MACQQLLAGSQILFDDNSTKSSVAVQYLRFPLLGAAGKVVAVGNFLLPQLLYEQYGMDPSQAVASQYAELQLLLDSMRSVVWYLDGWGLVKTGNRCARDMVALDRARGAIYWSCFPIGRAQRNAIARLCR